MILGNFAWKIYENNSGRAKFYIYLNFVNMIYCLLVHKSHPPIVLTIYSMPKNINSTEACGHN